MEQSTLFECNNCASVVLVTIITSDQVPGFCSQCGSEDIQEFTKDE